MIDPQHRIHQEHEHLINQLAQQGLTDEWYTKLDKFMYTALVNILVNGGTQSQLDALKILREMRTQDTAQTDESTVHKTHAQAAKLYDRIIDRMIMSAIKQAGQLTIDEIIANPALPVADVERRLAALCDRGVLQRLAYGQYEIYDENA